MSNLTDEVLDEADQDDTRRALDRALVALDREKRRTALLSEAVYRAASDASRALELSPVPEPRHDRRRGSPEVAVLVLSDWQLGKLTPSYNSAICEERIHRLADKVERLTAIQRSAHPVREIRVWLLGDIVEGELIFPGQAHKIDSSLYRQVCLDGPRILGDLLRRLRGLYERVEVTAVIGNHGFIGGQSRREMDPETNADRMLYRITAGYLEGRPGAPDRWTIPDGGGESYWYAVDRIGNYSSLLFHGYNLKGQGGMPWYSLQKKVGGWALGALEDFIVTAGVGATDVDFGHWHQPTRVTLNRVTARCNGSTESHNTYAQEQLAAVGRPSQGLRFVHPAKGRVTAEYTVDLDGDEEPAAA